MIHAILRFNIPCLERRKEFAVCFVINFFKRIQIAVYIKRYPSRLAVRCQENKQRHENERGYNDSHNYDSGLGLVINALNWQSPFCGINKIKRLCVCDFIFCFELILKPQVSKILFIYDWVKQNLKTRNKEGKFAAAKPNQTLMVGVF